MAFLPLSHAAAKGQTVDARPQLVGGQAPEDHGPASRELAMHPKP
jgi:hypothetical protein